MNYDDLLKSYKELMTPIIPGWDIASKSVIPGYTRVDREPISDEEKDLSKRNLSDALFSNYPGFDFSKYDEARQKVKDEYVRKAGQSVEEFSADKNSFMAQLDQEIVHMKANEVKEVFKKEVAAIEKNIDARISALNKNKAELVKSGLSISVGAELAAIDAELNNLNALKSKIVEEKDLFFINAAPYNNYKYVFMTTPHADIPRLNRYFKSGQLTGKAFTTNIESHISECKTQISNNLDEINTLKSLMKEPATNVMLGIDVDANQAIVDDYKKQINDLISKNEEIQFELDFYELARKMNHDSIKESRDYDATREHRKIGETYDQSIVAVKKAEESMIANLLKKENVDKFDRKIIERYYVLSALKNQTGFTSAMAVELESLKKKLISDGRAMNLIDGDLYNKYLTALGESDINKTQFEAATTFRNNNVPDHGRTVTVTFEGGSLYGVPNPLKIEVGNHIQLNYNPNPKPKTNLSEPDNDSKYYPVKDGYDFVGWTYDEMGTLNKPFEFTAQRVEVDFDKLSPEQKNRRNELILKQQNGYLSREESKELDSLTFREVYSSPMINYNITVRANFLKKTRGNETVPVEKDKCVVSFDTNGGHRDDFDYPDVEVPKGGTLTDSIPDPVLDDDHEFAGWTVDGTDFDPTKPIDKDTNLVAKYKDKEVKKTDDDDNIKITYVDKDGNELKTVAIPKNTTVAADQVPKAPDVLDMDFAGWVKENGVMTFPDEKFEKDTTLKAFYVPSKYITIKFVGEDGEVYREEKIERGSKYQKLTPERDKNGKRIKGIKENGKRKHTTRLYGWLDENGEKVDFDEQKFDHSVTLKANCKFNWERVASVGAGALVTALGLTMNPVLVGAGALATSAVMGVNAGAGVISLINKTLVDKGIIFNKKQPLTSIKTPSDRLKNFFIKAYNKTLASAEMWDNIVHATLTGVAVGGAFKLYDKLNPDPVPEEWNDFNYENQYSADTTTNKLDLTKIQNGDPVYDDESYLLEGTIEDVESWHTPGTKLEAYIDKFSGDATKSEYVKIDLDGDALKQIGDSDVIVKKVGNGSETWMGRFKAKDVLERYISSNTIAGGLDIEATIDKAIESAVNSNPSASYDIVAKKVSEKLGQVVTADRVTQVIGSGLTR